MKSDLEKLNAIVEASKKLASTLDLDELLNIILDVALTELEAERGTAFLLDMDKSEIFSRILKGDEIQEIRLPIGKGISGTVAQTGEIILIDDAYSDPRFDPEVDRRSGFRTRSILCLPMKQGDEIIGVLQLLNKKSGMFSKEDAEYLGALAAHMVIAVQTAVAHKERIEQVKTKRELELAAQIQQTLLPKSTPDVAGLRIDSFYQPCREVGGDIYDFFKLPGDKCGIMLADVSGKGVPAAMITAAVHAYVHALVETYRDPATFCQRLNKLLHRSTPSSSYATMTFVEYDPGEAMIRYTNCGHLPGMLMKSSEIEKLMPTGTVLGLLADGNFSAAEVPLQKGDTLLLYTDGLSEAAVADGGDEEDPEEFGLERIERVCHGHLDSNGGLLEILFEEVKMFTNDTSFDDDLTMINLRFSGGNK